MRVQGLLVFVGVMALVGGVAVEAQPLRVAARGTKTIALSDRVGRNQFTWTSDAPLEKTQGTAEGVTGSLTLDPQNLATLRGSISAQVATMKSGNATRDQHLKGPQWLDAGKFPQITFTIASVGGLKIAGNKASGQALGTFSMHGISKQIAIPFSITWLDESAATRKRAPGDLVMVSAEFSISLKDFKVAGAKGIVGSKVGETISIKAQIFGSTS